MFTKSLEPTKFLNIEVASFQSSRPDNLGLKNHIAQSNSSYLVRLSNLV